MYPHVVKFEAGRNPAILHTERERKRERSLEREKIKFRNVFLAIVLSDSTSTPLAPLPS